MLAEAHTRFKRKLQDADETIAALRQQEAKNSEEGKVARELLKNASERLQAGIDEQNSVIVRTSNELLKVTQDQLITATAATEDVRDQIRRLELKKRKVYDDMSAKFE